MRSVWRGSGAQKGTHHDARATALAALFALDVPRIARIFKTTGLGTGIWKTSPAFAERTVGYLCVSAFDADSAPGLIRATVDHLMRRAAGATEKGGPKVDAILEEAGTFGPLEQLNFYVNLLRGAGVNVVVVLQSIEQLWARLGRDYANSALSAGGCFVFGRMSSPESARWVEELAGTTRVPRPREYTPLWLGALGAVLDGVAYAISAATGDDGRTGRKASHRRGEDDRVVVPRFPASCLYGFGLDPDLKEGRWEKLGAHLRLFWSRRRIMRVGQYLVLAHGCDPFLLDTRRHRQIFPLYGPHVFRAFVKGSHGGKLGKVRYRVPPEKREAAPWTDGAPPQGSVAAESDGPPVPREELVPRFEKRQKECSYCGHPNDASADKCEIETCGTPLP